MLSSSYICFIVQPFWLLAKQATFKIITTVSLFPCVTSLGLLCHSCKRFASSLQLRGCNCFFVSLFPCPFTTEGEQKGPSGQSSKCFVCMSIAIMELLHLWTFRHVCSSRVGSKCSRSAGYLFAVGQPIHPNCKILKKTRKRKVGEKIGEGSLQRDKQGKSWSKSV